MIALSALPSTPRGGGECLWDFDLGAAQGGRSEKREEALARKCCREDFLRDKDRNENGWLCWRKRLDAERW